MQQPAQGALASHPWVREPPRDIEPIRFAMHNRAPRAQGCTKPHPKGKAKPHNKPRAQGCTKPHPKGKANPCNKPRVMGRAQAKRHPPNAGQATVGGERLAHHTSTKPRGSMKHTMASTGARQVMPK
ncbi:hypothetical protein V6N12_019231 [Hibiscus sabdariffa]|uniref:Uncharacterized protein n=1 Tax=Hibiscus sabdariffa TaxID=183260 RepID=A0ABR2C6Z1_9ROSI